MRTLEVMLGVNWDQLDRARTLNSSTDLDELGSFSAAVASALARERRKDFRGEGRRLCVQCAATPILASHPSSTAQLILRRPSWQVLA